MANLNRHDPTQKPSQHHDIGTFRNPIRKIGPDVTAYFDDLESYPTAWAAIEPFDRMDIQLYLEDDEDEADEEDLDVDDDEDVEDDEELLINANGSRRTVKSN